MKNWLLITLGLRCPECLGDFSDIRTCGMCDREPYKSNWVAWMKENGFWGKYGTGDET